MKRKKKTKVPKWLIKRMEALKKLPPPTLEEVETSFRAAERQRKENPYKDKDIIK